MPSYRSQLRGIVLGVVTCLVAGLTLAVPAVATTSHTVRGRVTDQTGAPVAGAVVIVDDDWATRTTTTGDDGRYSASGLTQGNTASVCVNPVASPVTPQGSGLARACGYTPLVAAVTRVDVILTEGGSLDGQVLDAARNPQPGVPVTVEGPAALVPFVTLTTDSNGHIGVDHLLPGTYHLCATPPAGTSVLPGCADVGVGPFYHYYGAVILPTAATVTGRVRGLDGAALAGVPVHVWGSTVVTDRTGRYTVSGLTPGQVSRACATPPPDYRGGTSPGGYLPRCSALTAYRAGSTRVDLMLVRGAGASGVITDARTGAPVAGAMVCVCYQDDGVPVGGEVTSAADGTWSRRGLDPTHQWQATASSAAASPGAAFGYQDTSAAGTLTLRTGAVTTGIDIALPPMSEVAGTVTDEAGNRLGFGSVSFSDDPSIFSSRATTRRGTYVTTHVARYGANPPDVAVCAWIQADLQYPTGLAITCSPVTLSATAADRRDFVLPPGAVLTGTTSPADPGILLWIDVPNFGRLERGGASGTTFSAVPAGTVVVHAANADGSLTGQSAPVTVTAGQTASYGTIELTPGGS